MKIRQGFVSNSSSSSFCILGLQVTQEQYDEIGSRRRNKETNLNIENAIDPDDDSVFAGYNPEQMKDDETLGQFKDRMIAEFKKFNIDIKKEDIIWITDGGYNG